MALGNGKRFHLVINGVCPMFKPRTHCGFRPGRFYCYKSFE